MPDNQAEQSPSVPAEPTLSPVEARVLACLMEKQRTTPDAYPLTLNGLVQACNQKSSRNPVMSLEVGEVGHTLNELRERGLIHASFAGRTERYDHKMVSSFHLNREEQAVLTVLMLRGPQTPGEIKTNVGRMAEFPDLAAVEATLRGMEERAHPIVKRLPRLPGRREERFAHLLCGEVEQAEPMPEAVPRRNDPRDARLQALEAEVADLKAQLDALWDLTGLAGRRPPS
jgi:uncharacterized protein YceH (UPF0502 family)